MANGQRDMLLDATVRFLFKPTPFKEPATAALKLRSHDGGEDAGGLFHAGLLGVGECLHCRSAGRAPPFVGRRAGPSRTTDHRRDGSLHGAQQEGGELAGGAHGVPPPRPRLDARRRDRGRRVRQGQLVVLRGNGRGRHRGHGIGCAHGDGRERRHLLEVVAPPEVARGEVGATKEMSGLTWGAAYYGTDAKGSAGQCYRNAFNRDLGKGTVVLSVAKTWWCWCH